MHHIHYNIRNIWGNIRIILGKIEGRGAKCDWITEIVIELSLRPAKKDGNCQAQAKP